MRRSSGRVDDSIYRRPTDPEAQEARDPAAEKGSVSRFRNETPNISKNRRTILLSAVGALAAFALLVTIPRILSQGPAEPFGPPEPVIVATPAPDPFTFEALVLTDSLAYALEGALTGPVNYTAGTPDIRLESGSFYTLIYDGAVIESHPPQVTITQAELQPGVPAEIIPRIPIADVTDLMEELPNSVLVDARELPAEEDRLYIEAPVSEERQTLITYTIPYHASPLSDYHLPPKDNILFVYGGDDQEALECGEFLKDLGYGSVISLGSISEYSGELSSLPPDYAFPVAFLPQEPSQPQISQPVIEVTEAAILNSEELAGKISADLLMPGPSAAGATFTYRHSHDLPLAISAYFDLYRYDPGTDDTDPSWSLIPSQPHRGLVSTGKGTFYPPFERGSTYSHHFTFWHDYPDLISGDYRLVYEVMPMNDSANPDMQAEAALMMSHFALDNDAIRAIAMNEDPKPSEYADIPGLTAKVHPYAHSTGDAWVTVDIKDEETPYVLDGKYEIHQRVSGQWLHMATIDDSAFGAARSVSPNQYYIWQPIIGPLEPGRYRIVHPLRKDGEPMQEAQPQALTIGLTIAEDTGTEKQVVSYEVPADESTLNLLSPFSNGPFIAEITELTPEHATVTLTNTSEEIQYYSGNHHLLRRMETDTSVPFFDAAAWHYLSNDEVQRSVAWDVITVEPGDTITIEADLRSAYGELKPSEYILSIEMNNPYGPSMTRFASVMFIAM